MDINFKRLPIREKVAIILSMQTERYTNVQIAKILKLGKPQRVSQYITLMHLCQVVDGETIFSEIDSGFLSFDRVWPELQRGRNSNLAWSVRELRTEAEARRAARKQISRGYNPALGRNDGRRRRAR